MAGDTAPVERRRGRPRTPVQSKGARDTARWRARQRAGIVIVQVEVAEDAVEALVAAGFFTPELADRRACIKAAVQAYIDNARAVIL